MYFVYILSSLEHERYYVGHTENLENRLDKHNKGRVKSTKNYLPWKIIYTEKFTTRNEAYKRELHIKSYKHGEAFKKLINNYIWVDTEAVKRDRL